MTEADFVFWLDAYREAWEGRDADAAAALFTEDATYQWGPFEEAMRGREAIRARWAETVGAQENVEFGYEPLAVTGDRGINRWWASFAVPAAQLHVRLDGIFVVRLDADRRCTEFREWWNAEETPLSSS